ncbi:excinuclease ABC subunit B [Candidatus Collierbacteria bacterium RIFCSPLOWO2_01_FULL_50_23]|nr:MAG: excinuclease ABC subunit B [Candidatus Collierbacteria bacterium RIFCSPLOWO2_01_FULL_50_23]
MDFKLKSDYRPTGDQPKAIDLLTRSIEAGNKHQTLVGVTGSGKTFTIANVIKNTQLPTLVVSHNKTLAAQLYQELRDFFPDNAVSYFVSYYDYYQPEAYIPQTDTYIEKEADINAEIDRLRLSATANLVSRPDCIVVASVSCIYNIGNPAEYEKYFLELVEGQIIDRADVAHRLLDLQYQRTTTELTRGNFRLIGNTLQLHPGNEGVVLSITFGEKTIESIKRLDPINFSELKRKDSANPYDYITTIYPAKHYITDPVNQKAAMGQIRDDLAGQIKKFKKESRILEAHRLEQKVNYDLAQIEEFGFVNGIENYSRYFDSRSPGDPPFTLLDYMNYNAKKFGKKNFLTIVDESHISLPQIKGMYRGDRSRKETLIDYGFRLPAALDNRPLNFIEFQARTPQTLYSSATPQELELNLSQAEAVPAIAEQLIRPTGLLDPEVKVFGSANQIAHLVSEVMIRKARGERTLILTITKRMAEDLTEYLKDHVPGLKVQYLHSGVLTLDRSDILDDLRKGNFDCLVGINLLREGIDLPEVSLVAILDADKEGFLRNPTSLIQTMGRAARHVNGMVYLYADRVSDSMKQAMDVTGRRRQVQIEHNESHGITPVGIVKPIKEKLLQREEKRENGTRIKELEEFGWKKPEDVNPEALTLGDKKKLIRKMKALMTAAAKNWDFEMAAKYRDLIAKLS